MAYHFTYLEQIVIAIHNGYFANFMPLLRDGNNRALLNYMYVKKCSIKEAADDLGMEEKDVKKRIINMALVYDKMSENRNYESFSRRGR